MMAVGYIVGVLILVQLTIVKLAAIQRRATVAELNASLVLL
jgi:hypothetical protein